MTRAPALSERSDRGESKGRRAGIPLLVGLVIAILPVPPALEPYAWRWYRVGAPDNALYQSDLSVVHRDAPTARDPGKS